MAGILRTDSIIADSIASSSSSSSPPRPVSEDIVDSNASTLLEPPTKVKRVGRTYGRPRTDAHVGSIIHDDPASRARILKTAPRDADDLVIPQSDDVDERPLIFGGFDWRAELKAIDEEFDMPGEKPATESTPIASTTEDDASTARQDVGGRFQPPLVSPLPSLSHLSLTASDEQTNNAASAGSTDALFDGARSSLLSSGPSPVSASLPGRTPLSSSDNVEESASFSKYRASYKRVVESPNPSESDNASPQHLYPFNSPKQRSSPTPPTSPLAEEFALHDTTASGDELVSDGIKSSKKKRETTKGKGRDKSKARGQRPKAPTKKEVVEIQKESARLLADQHVSIPRTQTKTTHTIASLFHKLRHAPTIVRQDSDPITSFSSPGQVITAENASSSDDGPPVKSVYLGIRGASSKPTPAVVQSPRIPSPERDSIIQAGTGDADEEMPEAGAILLHDEEKRLKQAREQRERGEVEKRARDLEMRKRKALEITNRHSGAGNTLSKAALSNVGNSDTDDDLEIIEDMVGLPRASHVREGKDVKRLFSSGVQIPFGGKEGERGTTSGSNAVVQKSLKLAAKPIFLAKISNRKGGEDVFVSHTDLNNLMLQQADKQSDAIEEKKKEQWIKAGGTFKSRRGEETSMTDWLHKGSTRKDAMDVDGDDEDDDPEYIPEGVDDRGADDADDSGGGAGDVGAPDDELVLEHRMVISDEEADADKENHRPATRRQSARAIVDSDDSDETADHVASRRPVVLVPDTSFGEGDGDSPSEDKENAAELAFDLSEDKENARVPRHLPRGRLFDANEHGGDGIWPSSSSSVFQGSGSVKSSREPLGRLDAEGDGAFMPPPLAQRRDPSEDRVLQVLHEEDKDATLALVVKGALHRSSSSLLASDDEDAAGPKPVLTQGFSQLFARDSPANGEDLGPKSALGEGGFTQFFSQENPESDIPLKSPLNDKSRSGLAAMQDDFEFTQPNALLPSVKISSSQRREIDDMFGKDQEFKLDEAKRCREPVRATASSVSDLPAFNFRQFTPSQPSQLSPHSIRRPLETLSLDSGGADIQFDESPGNQPFRRGRLRRDRPRNQEGARASISPSPPPFRRRNAFDVLRDAAKGKGRQRPAKAKQTIEKSEFVQAEAQESDDEAMFGFGGAKGDDDEEGGDDDPNAVVEGLVDDTVLDEKTQAADLVLEKHMEHQVADDVALEKLHQDAVEGKLRGKRRDRGIGFEDSDSDEEFRGPRKPLNKKRRVEGDTLDTYGENPETRPFYNAYQADLAEDEDSGLAYLQQQDSVQMHDRSDGSGEEEEVVDPAEVRRQALEIQHAQLSPSQMLDPDSADWVDSSDQDTDDEIRVEDGPLHPRKVATGSHPSLDHVGYRGLFQGKKTATGEQVQLKTWATQEARAHSSASGRGGFSRRDGSKSSRKLSGVTATTKGSVYAGEGHALAKSSSLISRVEKRQGFEDQP